MEQKVLKLFIEHARGFLDALENLIEGEGASEEQTLEHTKQNKTPPTEVVENQEINNTNTKGIYTLEDLNKMSFNDLKSLGASLGVNVKGKRSEIETNILEYRAEDKEDDTPDEDNTGDIKDNDITGDEPEDEDNKILKACEEMSEEELKSILKEAGLRTNGRKTALIDRVIKAVTDGIIEWLGDEEEENSSENNEETEDNDIEDIYADFPELAVNDPVQCKNITKERLNKLVEIDKMYVEEEPEENEEMNEFLVGFFGADFKIKEFNLEKRMLIYYELMKLFVDDDGEEHETSEAYYINGELYCCAKPLDKKGKCSVCHDVYDLDDLEE